MKINPREQAVRLDYPTRERVRSGTRLLKQAAVVAAILALPSLTAGCMPNTAGGLRYPIGLEPPPVEENTPPAETSPAENPN
jgi:hypothetical protein